MPWIKLDSSRSGSTAAQDGQGGRAVAGRQQLVRDVTRYRSGAPVSLRGQARCAAGSSALALEPRRGLDASRKLLTQRDFRPPRSSCGKVVPQLLRPELADVELRTDSADGGNTSSCQVSREHHGGALPELIGDVHVECWPGATAGACTLRMQSVLAEEPPAAPHDRAPPPTPGAQLPNLAHLFGCWECGGLRADRRVMSS
jgi:hypothetical protein